MAGEGEIQPPTVGVKGERLHWARTQLQLSMLEVQQRGGPSKAYQSEVESGKKTEVRANTLSRWVKAVGATEVFARGHIPTYNEDQTTCFGLARPVVALVQEAHSEAVWRGMSALPRFRKVLSLTAFNVAGLTPVVLAYVLGIELKVLHELINGRLLVSKHVMRALCDITTLSQAFIKYGTWTSVKDGEGYGPAVELALAKRMTPDQLYELVRRWEPPAAGGAADDSPGPNSL